MSENESESVLPRTDHLLDVVKRIVGGKLPEVPIDLAEVRRRLEEVDRRLATQRGYHERFTNAAEARARSTDRALAEAGARLDDLGRQVLGAATAAGGANARLERLETLVANACGGRAATDLDDEVPVSLDELLTRVLALEARLRLEVRPVRVLEELEELTAANVLDLLERDLPTREVADAIAARHAEAVRGTAVELAQLRRELENEGAAHARVTEALRREHGKREDELRRARATVVAKDRARRRFQRALETLARQYLRQTRQPDVSVETLVDSLLVRVRDRELRDPAPADVDVGVVDLLEALVTEDDPEAYERAFDAACAYLGTPRLGGEVGDRPRDDRWTRLRSWVETTPCIVDSARSPTLCKMDELDDGRGDPDVEPGRRAPPDPDVEP